MKKKKRRGARTKECEVVSCSIEAIILEDDWFSDCVFAEVEKCLTRENGVGLREGLARKCIKLITTRYFALERIKKNREGKSLMIEMVKVKIHL